MKPVLPLLLFSTTLFSCASVYKTGQTPDDVYFSPARPQAEYVRVDEQNDNEQRRDVTIDESEERYSRMRMRNRRQWSQFDDYYVDPRAYYYNPYFVNPYAMQYWGWGADRLYWNNWYHPRGNRVIVVNPNNRNNNSRVRNYNPYVTPQSNNNYKYQSPSNSNSSRNNSGSRLRGLFNDGGSSGSSSPTFKGGSGSNSGGGSSPSRSSSAPVRRY